METMTSTRPVTASRAKGAAKAGGPPFPGHITTEILLVTPADAERYLETMHANRTKSRLEIGIFDEVLREGKFFAGISPVYVDNADRAWDGQHRFEAIVKTGVPAWMLFVRGVTPEEAEYIDTGRKRTYADSLRMLGVADYQRRSVLSRMLALHAKGGIEAVRNPSGVPLTRLEKDAWVDAPGIAEAIRMGEGLARAVNANPSYAAYNVFRTARGERPAGIDSDGFWESVRTGVGLEKNDPALTLRDFLMKGKTRFSRSGKVDPRLMELYVMATAWNKHVVGEKWSRPNPVFEVKGGQKVFPASQVPELLPLDPAERARVLREMRAAFGRLKGGEGAIDYDYEEKEAG